ncbi:MAG: TylF/MycF/NovP-related O-methyltransferase [Thermodesulfobacteriota bacterium]
MTHTTDSGGSGRYVCSSQQLYLDLLVKSILGLIYEDPPFPRFGSGTFDLDTRIKGLDWPTRAHTMVGLKRLMNARQLAENVLWENVPGDFFETGVWRGGVGILLRGVLSAYGVAGRRVWLADSFEGLPAPDKAAYPSDSASAFHTCPELAVDMEQVKNNFRKYDLLDDQVVFLKGWFKDTLPVAPVEQIALLRLDGDLYESTMQALTALYDKVSENGYIIIDDYHCVPQCAQAVEDFCALKNIAPVICEIDGVGVYWQKTSVPASCSAGENKPLPELLTPEARFVKINQVFNKRYVQLAERDAMIAERDARLAESREQIAGRDAELAERRAQIAERDARLAERDARLAEREALARALEQTIELMRKSRSWRITAPLRYITSDLFRKK